MERNPGLDCTEFDFFDAFSGIDFDFIMTDTTDYISYKPEMKIKAYDPNISSRTVVEFGDVAPEKMLIDITLPLTEQEKLPVF